MKYVLAGFAIALTAALGVIAFDPHMDIRCAVSTIHDRATDKHRGWQCLHYAAARGDRAGVESILDNGLSVNLRTRRGRTPLILAAQHGHLGVVHALLARHAGLEARDGQNGFTALHWAADRYHPAIARALLVHGARVDAANKWNQTPLWQAAWQTDQANTEIAHILVAAGADFDHPDIHGNTPLLMAARAGHRPMIAYLLDLGADINARNRQGQTPLYQAVAGGHPGAVRLLLARGAPPDAAVVGQTPLARAVTDDRPEIIDLLRANGATGYRRYAAERALRRGRAAYTDGRYADAVAAFSDAIAFQPDQAQAYYRRGLARAATGASEPAAADLRAAIAYDDQLHAAREALARLYVDHGDFARAIAPLGRLVAAEPDNPRALYLLGESRRGLGEAERAGPYFAKACALGFEPACSR
ncbi:ankyrin repeat domain-containing protein [Salinisphaera sp. T31B1]|uniref:ankyrin repeat domain-containing protein n=1 Tax=Salinisphaera sp. T31B1 TaxID=727963 RepID=UPI003341FB74